MPSYVTLRTDFWDHTVDWPKDAKLLYLYLWTNLHAHGVIGIGFIADRVIQAELGMTSKALAKAFSFLEGAPSPKVLRSDGWYLVLGRAGHTCFQDNGAVRQKMVASAANAFSTGDIPADLINAFKKRYPTLSIPYQYPIDSLLPARRRAPASAPVIQDLQTIQDLPTLSTKQIKSRRNTEALRLAQLLHKLILERKPDYKSFKLDASIVAIDRMLRLDERVPERVEAVIRWCQADDFWQNNILSGAKLRTQFDQLELKMQQAEEERDPLGAQQKRLLAKHQREQGEKADDKA